MKRYLLDTSFLIDLMRKHPVALSIHQRIKGEECTSIICAYELAKYSDKAAEAILKKETMPFERMDAIGSASIYRGLKEKGEMIPEMDIMIAGQATSRGLILVSRDHHFKRVEGLSLQFYSDQDE